MDKNEDKKDAAYSRKSVDKKFPLASKFAAELALVSYIDSLFVFGFLAALDPVSRESFLAALEEDEKKVAEEIRANMEL